MRPPQHAQQVLSHPGFDIVFHIPILFEVHVWYFSSVCGKRWLQEDLHKEKTIPTLDLGNLDEEEISIIEIEN